jgi:hypothetical protein
MNPLGTGMMLLLFLGQELLDSESLVRRHGEKMGQMHIPRWWTKAEEQEETLQDSAAP